MTRRVRIQRQGTIVALPRPAAMAVRATARFLHLEASGGILLIGAAIVALLMANSPLEEFYDHFREMPVVVQVGVFEIAKPLLLWINDGLMAVFFLLVSLEIKREALSGQLSTRAQVMLPVICAFAGVAVPALIYAGFNRGDADAMRGWAIPTATDIAFALGVLSLLGSRVPLGMKVLLSTIAVVDDLIAILIIAVFYSHGLSVGALAAAAVALALMLMLNRRGVTALTPYLLLGTVLWICVLKSSTRCIPGWPTCSCRCSRWPTQAWRSATSPATTWRRRCRWASRSACCWASRSASSALHCWPGRSASHAFPTGWTARRWSASACCAASASP